ncbi:hypothetical protein ARZXY2_4117 [Arthrobacter sp. ZXY-2]|nr:hypothetical protein ARZXY2_4117 [Arthrobacter sp. ZXY-2]
MTVQIGEYATVWAMNFWAFLGRTESMASSSSMTSRRAAVSTSVEPPAGALPSFRSPRAFQSETANRVTY